MGIVILLIFFAAAWLLLIVPRQRQLRRHQLLMTQLEPGDDVIMASGVYGTIRAIDDDVVLLEVAPGVELKITKRAIAAKVDEAETDASASVVDLSDDDDAADGTPGRDRPDGSGT
jgi:preprotein translocase subunit YajC